VSDKKRLWALDHGVWKKALLPTLLSVMFFLSPDTRIIEPLRDRTLLFKNQQETTGWMNRRSHLF